MAAMRALRAARGFDGVRFSTGPVTVVVADGQVAAVESGWPDLGSTVEVVDHPGATVLPGLIDMHVHLGGDGRDGALDRLPDLSAAELDAVIDAALAAQLAAGVTTVRDLGDRHYAVLERRDRREAGVPAILAAGPPITSVRGHCWSMGGEAEGVDALRAAVQERVERGADVVKVMAGGGVMTPGTDVLACQFTAGELRAIVEEAHRLGVPVTAHAHGLPAVERAVAAGVDGVEHFGCLTPEGPRIPDGLLRTLVDRRIAVCPTLGIAPGAVPSPPVQAILERFGLTLEKRRTTAGRLHAAGLRLVSGTDAGVSGGKKHGLLPHAIADLVAGGIPIAEALATATSDAAAAAGFGGRTGALAVGRDADLVVVDGDLSVDIGALLRVAAVYVRGERAWLVR